MKYFEDFRAGESETLSGYELQAAEIVEFARLWDPQPMHIDPEAGGGVIASGAHLVAITVRQLVSQPERVAVVAGLGWDEVRFRHPGRPGDVLFLTRDCIEVRGSNSKPDRGIVRNRITLRNQNGVELISYIDTLLVARRS